MSKTAVAVGPTTELAYERNPRNWSTVRRWYIAMVIWNLVAPIDMCSTLYSGAQSQVQDRFGVSHFVVTLGVGLVNFGFAIGPLIGAPLSELYGRQPVYIGTAVSFTLFSLGSAVSQSISALLITRFFSGFLGAAVFSNFGGSLSDMFTPDERGPLVALFALVLQGAPTIGPVPGSFMGQYVGWRWIMGLTALWSAFITIPVLFLPETEVGAIKRKILRQANGRKWWQFGDGQNEKGKSGKDVWGKALLTPLMMLFWEPIVAATSLYHAFIYGLLFILLEAYPYVFRNTYNFSLSSTGLVFISPWIGNVVGVLLYFGYFKPSYTKKQHALHELNDTILSSNPSSLIQKDLKPEARLPGMLVSAVLVPVGLFWFALTCSHPSIHWMVPTLSGIPVGAGMTLLQLSLSNYYIDLYPTLSASALAANVFVRNMLATWFPTFSVPMYEKLGMQNAGLVLAGISLAGIPGGWVLWKFGGRLRSMSGRAAQDSAYMVHGDGFYAEKNSQQISAVPSSSGNSTIIASSGGMKEFVTTQDLQEKNDLAVDHCQHDEHLQAPLGDFEDPNTTRAGLGLGARKDVES
ncbi:major facilitator superfamily domain-containing protein [Crucibulum laeve]|uniref:Major facilitator superfamily domain-containing protein n=1 Tax=Crucibulum laeve TaxID=68775 RepID=A0A5C3LGG6_9AGAR|nr:major facilitator superfamily domain-containing protein [Crucibulum laeve]